MRVLLLFRHKKSAEKLGIPAIKTLLGILKINVVQGPISMLQGLVHLLQRVCFALEFLTRLVLVNIPSYLLAVSPEIDRISTAVNSYLLFQDVGFCWAFLLNASIAIACSPSSFFHARGNDDARPSHSFVRLTCSFYVLYASIRVVVAFANSTLSVALESIHDFPRAAKVLHSGGKLTLRLSVLIFFPSLLLECGLISADFMCFDDNPYSALVCKHSGLNYLTSKFPYIRKVVLHCTAAMVVQVSQVLLHEFPRWDQALKHLSLPKRLSFQVSVVIYAVSAAIYFFAIPDSKFEPLATAILLLWTLWLLLFTPVLIEAHGQAWIERTTPESLQHLAAYCRLSLMLLFAICFGSLVFTSGFLEAQLQLTFYSVIIPMQYVFIYYLAHTLIQGGLHTVYLGVPLSFLFALLVTFFSQTGGNGSIFLVTMHCFGKVVQFFGENETPYEAESNSGYGDWHVDTDTGDEDAGALASGVTPLRRSFSILPEDCTVEATGFRRTASGASSGDFHAVRPGALLLMEGRGQENSSLVSLGLPASLSKHWTVVASRRNLRFISDLARTLAVTDNFLASIMRIAAFILATVASLVCIISIASLAQQSFKLFPELITYYKLSNSSVIFDHRIANLTLHPSHELLRNISRKANHRSAPQTCERPSITQPYYAACDWSWHGYNLLDFALLSELAYFDESEKGQLKAMISDLFPEEKFAEVKTISDARLANGPLFFELSTKEVTVIAIRGTDVGRLRDFMEDLKLFGEPIVITMLSAIFPTIRLWSNNTAARVIEWLYELNSFFGLQEEAEYYKPLVERVLELAALNKKVIITGHSLGGGLARIVGALTEQPSVSFSPPGLAMSHRKYSITHSDGTVTRIDSRKIHGRSLSVVTDHDFLAQVDHQVGLVQRITCDMDDKALQNSCHLLEGTICHILEHCGDRKRRFDSCTYTYDIAAALPSTALSNGHLAILMPALLLGPVMIALAIIPELI